MVMWFCMEFIMFRNVLKGKYLLFLNEVIYVFWLLVVSVNYDVDFIFLFLFCFLNFVEKVFIFIIKSLYLSFYVFIVFSICLYLLR